MLLACIPVVHADDGKKEGTKIGTVISGTVADKNRKARTIHHESDVSTSVAEDDQYIGDDTLSKSGIKGLSVKTQNDVQVPDGSVQVAGGVRQVFNDVKKNDIVEKGEQLKMSAIAGSDARKTKQEYSINVNKALKDDQKDERNGSHKQGERTDSEEAEKSVLDGKRKTNNESRYVSTKITSTSEKESNSDKKSTLFTIFDQNEAVKFNYKSFKYQNYGFLENAEELRLIKRMIAEQLDPDLRKRRQEEKWNKSSMHYVANSIVESDRNAGKIRRILRLYSLVYFNEKDWKVKANKQTITYKNKDSLKNDVVSILKVDKGSVVFAVNNVDDAMLKKVKKIVSSNVPYKNSYFIVKRKHKTFVVFKLFIGQSIDLETMRIEG